MANQRRVIRGGKTKGFKARALRFLMSFTTPTNFKRYWLNEDGAKRFAKIVGAGFLLVFLTFLYFAKDLPSPSKINAKIGSQNTIFYDRTGKVPIYEVHGDKNRRVIDFNQMPQNLKDATVAIEDKNFYHEGAFSVFGYLRAAFYDVTHRGAYQGGSTITQQYVKNALLDPSEHTITRKIKELILSIEIDQLYKKDDVLKLYLNEIPYGSQAYGIESACRTYFSLQDKNNPNDNCTPHLNLQQATLLAAIPNAPTYYSPYGEHTDDLLERQHLILDRMAQQHYISQKDANANKLPGTPLGHFRDVVALNPAPQTVTSKSDYPHFALYAQEYLENKYGVNTIENGGLKVITTLDITKQQEAQAAINNPRTGINAVRRSGGSNVAMVSADPRNGQVLAMIGSYDPNNPEFGAFNVALANRQPGSSFKPFVYSTAMKTSNWGPGSTIYDVVTDFGGGYTPTNYDSRSHGIQSMRTALDGSLNVPAVKMLYIAGVSNSIKTAHDLGISTLNGSPSDYGLSLVLGAGEVKLNDMVNAYESFANDGVHFEATPILKVTDPHGHTLEDNSKPKSKKVLDPQIAYLMSNILSDDKSRQFIFGVNNPLHINGWNVGAKTGTTTGFRDAWTMGFSPDLVTGVWAGNNDNTPMTTEAVDIAAPIWHDYMTQALTKSKDPMTCKDPTDMNSCQGYSPSDNFTKPAGIKTVTLDSVTGKLPTPATKQTRTDVFPSWYKPETVAGTRTANVDKVSGKLATSCTPPLAIESRTSSTVSAEIPSTDPAYSRWEPPVAALAQSLGYAAGGSLPNDSDDVHHCDDIKPSVNVTATGSGPIHISATVTQGTNPVNNLTIYFDDQIISTTGGTSYSFDYNPTATGSHDVKAVVTDTALYQGSDETTVTVTNTGGGSGGGSIQGLTPNDGQSFNAGVGNITFSWTPGGNGNFVWHMSGPGGSPNVPVGSVPSYTRPVPTTPGTYTWWVTSGSVSSDPMTFKVH